MHLKLKDSQYIESNETHTKTGNYISLYCQAVDKLNNELKEIEIISLSNTKKNNELDKKIIWYEVLTTEQKGKKASGVYVVKTATFYTSHFIGIYSTQVGTQNISIEIKPRFGDGIFNYLISYAYNIYVPKNSFSSAKNSNGSNLWLITLMWKALLLKALNKSQIPKEYKTFQTNSQKFKGKLHISKHIRENLVDKSKFYCKYRKLTMDTTINRVIRYTYKLLTQKQNNLNTLLQEIAEYDARLQSFGVQQEKISLSEIKNIRYSKLNLHYKKVMELSKIIIQNQVAQSDLSLKSNNSFSYFLDISQIWEDYLLKVLQKNLPEYEIYSPNDDKGDNLFNDGYRQIRPDIIIKKAGEIVAILDAKYKWYDKIGKFASVPNGVSRDDLYQMTTYMYHYAKQDKKVLGLFISPMGQENVSLHTLANNLNHKIGVLNLNIEQFNNDFSLENINTEEKKFIKNLKKELQNDPL